LVGILLSGANADGTEGLAYIKKNSGKIWIQDPETAEVDYMPKFAIKINEYDLLVQPEDLADYIQKL